MVKKLYVFLFLSLFFFPVFSNIQAQSNVIPGQYIYAFDDNLLKSLLSKNKTILEQTLEPLLPSARERVLATETVTRLKRKVIGRLGKGRQRYLSLINAKLFTSRDNTPLDSEKLNYALQSGLIKYIDPNIKLSLFKTANDPDLSKLWAVHNSKTDDVDINADDAWDISTTSGDAAVAILDTGFDPNTADLQGNVWKNSGEIPGNKIDDDKNGYVDDITGCNFTVYETGSNDYCGDKAFNNHEHGTHVAGTIGAKGNNGIGVTGIVWDTKLVSLAFLGDDGSGSLSDMVEAMEYAIALKTQYKNSGGKKGANIKVMNASLGHNDGFLQSEYDAIKALDKADILYVAAAGNGGWDGYGDNNDTNPTYPASYDLPNIISVAALSQSGSLTYFSNYGVNSTHIAAPGDAIYSTVFDNKYAAMSGTSMAAPQVSGVAALVRGHRPQMPAWMVKQVLIASAKTSSTVKSLSSLQLKVSSGGMLDAKEALILSEQNFDKPIITKQPADQKGFAKSKASFSVNVLGQPPFTYEWLKDGQSISGGNTASLGFSSLTAADAGSYSVTVSNSFGSVTSKSAQLTITENSRGDLNFDGAVNILDMVLFMTSLGKSGKNLPADMNGDGVVNLTDLSLFLAAFNGQ
jgi:hypothetical protein